MCGIVASFPADSLFTEKALGSMADRGPDAVKSINLNFCEIGVSRLAITDLQDGEQPFLRNDGQLLIGFNGAIYNWRVLAEKNGFDLPTNNDAEIIAPLYQKFGLSFADHLEGMYSVVIYDVKRNCLITANDHFGVKPLYVVHDEHNFYVASTLQCFPIRLRSKVRRHIPGTVFSSSGEVVAIKQLSTRTGASPDDLMQALDASVAEQIPSDVPWGCFLSGGVDSSLIAALAKTLTGESPKTFCCGIKGSPDRLFAQRLADECGFDHADVEIHQDELIDAVERVVYATASYDPGIILNGLGVYFAARAAKEAGVKVILSGEGADELFGGYDEHRASPSAFLIDHLRFDQRHLGASECLRLDRCAMVWSIEARVPFLARSVVEIARSLAPEDLIAPVEGEVMNKVFLRRAAQAILPEWCAWRVKEPFFQGASLSNAVHELATSEGRGASIPYIPNELKKYPQIDLMAAWFKLLWERDYSGYESEWSDLQQRGLVRRRYTPFDFSPELSMCVQQNDV